MKNDNIQPDPNRVYIDDQINLLRRELLEARERTLDHRSQTISWWIAIMTAIFTLATVAIGLFTYHFNTQASRQLTQASQQLIETEENIRRLDKEEEALLRDIVAGDRTQVPIESFIRVVVTSRQVTNEEITQFIEAAYNIFAARKGQNEHVKDIKPNQSNSRDIDVDNVGSVSILGFRTEEEFIAIWDGLVGVLGALRGDGNLPGAMFLVHGMERRYFVARGIPNVPSRAGVRFELKKPK